MALRLYLLLLVALGLLIAGPAAAASYNYRSDVFAWETAAHAVVWDRSCTGYPGDDDQATIAFSGGFQFRFAGVNYSSVRVLANGMLQFGADTGFFRDYSNGPLPVGTASARSGCVATATARVLMAYWTDLNPSQNGSGNVTWEQKGTAPNRRLVVSWNGVYQYNTSTPYALQVILYENGEFKYQYGNANATGSGATIGVQVDAGDYTLYSYNSGYNANGSAIRWYQPSGDPSRQAEYRFDEYSYSGRIGEVADSSGMDNHGVRVGSASTVANGRVCRALSIPANSSASSSGVDSLLNISAGVGSRGALSFFFRGNSAWNSGSPGLLMDAGSQAAQPFYLQRDANGALRFRLSDSAGTLLTASTAAQSHAAGSWVHVAATWRLASGNNQSQLRLYVNGTLLASAVGTTNGNLAGSIGALMVGDNRGSSTPSGGTLNSANGAIDELRIYNYDIGPVEIALDRNPVHDCLPPLDHLELRHDSGSGLTCAPSTFTVVACQDASCSSEYSGGVSGSLASSGGTVSWPGGQGFAIAPGSSRSTVSLQLTSVGSTTLSASASSPSASGATQCQFGGSSSCVYSAAAAGFVLGVPDHRAETAQTLSIAAVRSDDASKSCAPAFANVSKALTLACSHQNPASGRRAVRLAGQALNSSGNAMAACDGAGRTLNLGFNAQGQATVELRYADAGRVQLTASYSGSGDEAGLQMQGTSSFIAAPSSFGISATGPFRAGQGFAATLSALNAAGAVTPSFGHESPAPIVALAHSRLSPNHAAASDGQFSGFAGSFEQGVAQPGGLSWSEVGSLRLDASQSNYLGSGMAVSGSSASVGPFTPHHFDLQATPACGSFSYAGQPFMLRIWARNAGNSTTVNYDHAGATARAGTLSEATALGLGALSGAAVPATAFSAGIATLNNSVSYVYGNKLGAPAELQLRYTDGDAISSAMGSPIEEASMPLRSGRLRLSNAFGPAARPLDLAVQAQYWSGAAWLLNEADSCSSVPAAAVVRFNALDARGQASAAMNASVDSAISLSAGRALLRVKPANPAVAGSLDLALNLGASAVDQACSAVSPRPSSSGAGLPWLRAQNGSAGGCGAAWDRDPSARASFGLAAPETRKTHHAREVF